MSLKNTLMNYKQQLEDIKAQTKIEEMLKEQREILDKLSPKKQKDVWNEKILSDGGVSTYTYKTPDGKKKNVKVSVCNIENDVVYKFHFRNANGVRVSVNSKTYSDAQCVVDALYGEGMYRVSGSVVK